MPLPFQIELKATISGINRNICIANTEWSKQSGDYPDSFYV